MHGEIIKGSVLGKVLSSNDLSIIGTLAAVAVNDIKHTCYCLEIKISKDAYIQSNSLVPTLDWLQHRSKQRDVFLLENHS